MKNRRNSKWSLLHVPVVSALLFVTIITAAPTIGAVDSNPTVKTAMGALYPRPDSAAEPVSSEETKSTPAPTAPTSVTSSTPASTKAVPAASSAKTKSSTTTTTQVKTQPSRSSTALTPTPTTSKTSAQPSTQSSNQTSKASAIIAAAKQYIGVHYVYGGTTPSGFDCSGFVQYVFAKQGINLPRVSRDQYKLGTSVSFSNLRAGDLVFFSLAKNGVIDHVGIYVGNGQFINASTSKGVTIYALGSYWQSAFLGAKRVL